MHGVCCEVFQKFVSAAGDYLQFDGFYEISRVWLSLLLAGMARTHNMFWLEIDQYRGIRIALSISISGREICIPELKISCSGFLSTWTSFEEKTRDPGGRWIYGIRCFTIGHSSISRWSVLLSAGGQPTSEPQNEWVRRKDSTRNSLLHDTSFTLIFLMNTWIISISIQISMYSLVAPRVWRCHPGMLHRWFFYTNGSLTEWREGFAIHWL
jgi:hypothetical protein